MSRGLRFAVAALVSAGMYVLLPLTGWGLPYLGDYLANPARGAYLLAGSAAALLTGVEAILMGGLSNADRRRPAGKVRRQDWVTWIVLAVGGLMLFLLPYSDYRGIAILHGFPVIRWVGLAGFSLGAALRFWAAIDLGTAFNSGVLVREGQHLTTSGLYGFIRHPRYLGMLLMFFSFTLIFRSVTGIGVSVALVPLMIWRIIDEERLMARKFGGEWEAYSRRVWRLIPFVY
jgi:protein-S-isoprenylcysteine O-methyltransferase Ste14